MISLIPCKIFCAFKLIVAILILLLLLTSLTGINNNCHSIPIKYPDGVYKVATAAILIQNRGVQSVFSLEKYGVSSGMLRF